MKKIVPIVILLLGVAFIGTLSAESLEERVAYLHQVLSSLNGEKTISNGEALGQEPGQVYKCATPLVLEAWRLEELHGHALGLEQFFARPSESSFPESYDSPGGHFKIHYTTAAGVDQATLGYVQTVAAIADSVWTHEVDVLGYHEPLNDADYEWGGDSRYDIYIKRLQPQYYGITFPESGPEVGNGYQATSYMELQIDYSQFQGYENRPLDALRVTLAHEFFHAIQFWYDAREFEDEVVDNTDNYSWLEMSSVWMEEETFDYVNDYYYYLPHYMPYVHLPLRLWGTIPAYPYGAGIFPMYLTQTFGRDIMRKIWERCAEVPTCNSWYGAIDGAIQEVSGGQRNFDDAFAEYGRWLYFTGTRGPSFFEEGANYYMIPELDTLGIIDLVRPYIRHYSDYPATVDRDFGFFPYYLGVSYVVFDVTSLDSGMTVDNFFGVTSSPEPVGWRVSVMGYNRFDPGQPVWVADSVYRNRDVIRIEKIAGVTDIVLVPVAANPYYNKASNVYQFTVYGSAIRSTKTTFHPPFPNPFKLSDQDQPVLRMEVILGEGVKVDAANHATAYLDVYTTGGERVYSSDEYGSPNGRIWLDWNGRNQDGNQVASGVYVMLVRVGDESETFKALVIR